MVVVRRMKRCSKMFYIEGVTTGERELTGEAKRKEERIQESGVEDKDYKWILPGTNHGQAGQI